MGLHASKLGASSVLQQDLPGFPPRSVTAFTAPPGPQLLLTHRYLLQLIPSKTTQAGLYCAHHAGWPCQTPTHPGRALQAGQREREASS